MENHTLILIALRLTMTRWRSFSFNKSEVRFYERQVMTVAVTQTS